MTADMDRDGLRYSPDAPYNRMGLSIHVSMFEYVRLVTGTFSETRSPGMGESGDWWS